MLLYCLSFCAISETLSTGLFTDYFGPARAPALAFGHHDGNSNTIALGGLQQVHGSGNTERICIGMTLMCCHGGRIDDRGAASGAKILALGVELQCLLGYTFPESRRV